MFNLPGKYRPVDIHNKDALNLWHSYEVKIFQEHNSVDQNPLNKSANLEAGVLFDKIHNEQIQEYSLVFARYFIIRNNVIAGIFAIPLNTFCQRFLLVESLYVEPDFRGQGLCRTLFNDLCEQSYALKLGGIRLQTEYHWKSAVKFYLHNHFWLLHWNDGLNFVRGKAMPAYRIEENHEWLHFCVSIDDRYRPLISARNDGSTLYWEEQEASHNVSEEVLLNAASTLSLHVSMRGWPMVRSGNSRWLTGDCGGPEALATQIAFWESPVSELGDWHDHIKELNKLQASRD